MIRHMLISSSLFIVLILQVRVCLKNHIPGRIYVMLWEIALLRLVLPLKIPILPDRLLNHIDTFSPNTVSLTTENVGKRFFIIWGIGFSISFIIAVINYYRERMLLAQSLPIEIDFTKTENLYTVPIRVSDRILSPVVYGIWKPCVVLPKAMNYNNLKLLQNVLLHEKAHIFWKDNLVKSLSAFIFCLIGLIHLSGFYIIFYQRTWNLHVMRKLLEIWIIKTGRNMLFAFMRWQIMI